MPRPPTFGILINEIEGTYQALMMQALKDVAHEFGVNLLSFPGHIPNDRSAYEREFNVVYRMVAHAPLDGLILLPQTFDWSLRPGQFTEMLREFGDLPSVCIDTDRPGLSCISTDHHTGMAALVDHFLLDHGYRRIVFIKGSNGDADADARLAAYMDRHRHAGLPVDPALLLEGRFSPHAAADAMEAFLDRGVPYDAVLAANDEMALAAIGCLLRRGVCVPDDVAVGGYDDVAGQAATPVPLTSVDHDVPDMVRRGMRYLMECRASHRAPRLRETNTPQLRLRSSCGCRGDHHAQRFGQLWSDPRRGHEVLDELATALRLDLRRLEGGQVAAAVPGLPRELVADEFDECLRHHLTQARTQQGSMADLRVAVQRLSREFAVEAVHQSREWERAMTRKLLDAKILLHEQGQTFRAEDMLRRSSRARTIWWAMQQLDRSTAYRLENVMAPLQDGLIQLGLRHALLVLYDEPVLVQDWEQFVPPDTVALAIGVLDGAPVPAERLGPFPAREFLPLWPFDRGVGLSMAVFPLFLQRRQYGYLVLDVGERMDTLFEQIRADVSGLITASTLIRDLSKARELLREDLGRQQLTNRQLSQEARRDQMTGLLNRRGFMARVEELRAAQPAAHAVLWLLDMDGLKQINDVHGHAAGDAALCAAARVLEAAFRDSDAVARLGGDEFAVFNHPASGEALPSIEARLAHLLEQHNRESGQPWRLAFSVGHCVQEPRSARDLEHMMAVADKRLYENKRLRKAEQARHAGVAAP